MARKSFISRHCLMVQDPTKQLVTILISVLQDGNVIQDLTLWQKIHQNDLPRKSCDDGTYYLKKPYQPACYCHLINDTQVKGLAVPAAVHLAG